MSRGEIPAVFREILDTIQAELRSALTDGRADLDAEPADLDPEPTDLDAALELR